MDDLIELKKSEVCIEKWIDEFPWNEITVDNNKIKITKKELIYYYKFYNFLKNNSYFEKNQNDSTKSQEYTAEKVKYNFVSCQDLLFEVTNACQLNYTYCGFGELYEGDDEGSSDNISFLNAKKLLDYYHKLKTLTFGDSLKKTRIGFYGGEPLLNIQFIREIVTYAKEKEWGTEGIEFSLTTNGLLLNKYMNFQIFYKTQYHIF